METESTASVIERGQGQGRLAIGAVDLSCGEPILVDMGDLGWTPVRVEWDSTMGWVGYLREGDGHGQASVLVFLRPGLRARRP